MKLKLDAIDTCPIEFPYDYNFKTMEYSVPDDFIRDLKYYLSGKKQDNFTTLLIQLIFKADHLNKIRLAEGYRAEVVTIWGYQNVPDFYKQLE